MPSKRPASPLSFADDIDGYFSGNMPYISNGAAAPYQPDNDRTLPRQKKQMCAQGMPSPPCSRTLSHDGLAHHNGSLNDNVSGSVESQMYYSSTMAGGVADLPAVYDLTGSQYQYPQARGYFNQSSYTLPNTPLEHPSFSQPAMQQYDVTYLAQTPNTTAAPPRQNMWDSRWNTLFDPPKTQDVQPISPAGSQYRQASQSDNSHLATELEAMRRQSTDTGASSVKSARSGHNPVSTVLAHHVYTILSGEPAWNMIKQLQRAEILRDVWSEIATLAHPDKAHEQAPESPLWEQIVAGKVSLNLQELCPEDLVLAVSGLAVLAKRAAQLQANTGTDSGASDPLRVFVDSHLCG